MVVDACIFSQQEGGLIQSLIALWWIDMFK